MGSFSFFNGAANPNGLNYARFSATVPITTLTPFDLGITSRDILARVGRQQNIVLKDIVCSIYIPTCIPDGGTVPQFSSAPCVALYSECTFNVKFNSGTIQAATVFTHNAETWRSPLWLADFKNAINDLAVTATIDFIDPAWIQAGFVARLACVLELYAYSGDSAGV